MFTTLIKQTEFSNPEINEIYSQIQAEPFRGDVTFESSLRALLYKRLSENDRVTLGRRKLSEVSAGVMDSIIQNIEIGEIAILDCGYNTTLYEVSISLLNERYTQFKPVNKISAFYSKSFKVSCFINEERHSVVLVVERIDISIWHYLQCSIVAFLPWFFQPDDDKKGVTEDELSLILSLRLKTSTKYLEYINKIAMDSDILKDVYVKRVKNLLSGFEHEILSSNKDKLLKEITYNNDEILRYNKTIADVISTNNQLNEQLLGIKMKLNSHEESEIMEYFLHNENLFLENAADSAIRFIVDGYCEYFDEDMAVSIIDNSTADIYYTADRFGVSIADTRLLLESIFVKQKIHLKFCAAYFLDIRGGVAGIQDCAFPSRYNKCMPNPHIDDYGCLGQYNMVINECLAANDYIGAIAQCVASCKSLNFGDVAVMGKFGEKLFADKCQCLELPDGEMVSALEAIEFLHKLEEDNNE